MTDLISRLSDVVEAARSKGRPDICGLLSHFDETTGGRS